jgi:hypothetical protein
MNDNELQPWVVAVGDAEERSLAMWRLSETEQPALALFSSAGLAEAYAAKHVASCWQVAQPARSALLGVMIECYRQGVRLAVLNPAETSAQRIFNLRDVLRAARQELA